MARVAFATTMLAIISIPLLVRFFYSVSQMPFHTKGITCIMTLFRA